LLFAWLAAEVMAGHTQALDEQVRLAVHAHSSPQLTAAMRFLSHFADPPVLILLSAAATAALVALRWKRSALLFVAAMLGGYVVDSTLKLAFHRARPAESFFGTPMPDSYSFPSGHALFSVCFFGTLALSASARVRSRLGRVAIWLGAGLVALAIGYSRVYLGVHYASEVVAGYLAGGVCVGAMAWLLRQC
jgi:undecaprenyl-diphosphatase